MVAGASGTLAFLCRLLPPAPLCMQVGTWRQSSLPRASRDLLDGSVFATASLCCILLPIVGLPPARWLWAAAASVRNIVFMQTMLQA